MIKIDGAYLEGGGQIVRTALALSAVTRKPFEVFNIRKGRCDSGLKPQHLFCVKALKEFCNAKATDVFEGSEQISFFPDEFKGRTLSINVGTAGSTTLLLQSLLLPMVFGDKKTRLRITGGTDVKWSQPVDYLQHVFLSHLRKFADIKFKLERRGYYPRGGGKIDLTIKPKFCLSDFNNFEEFHNHLKNEAPEFNLTSQGELMQIKGISHSSQELQKAEVAERQAKAARQSLKVECPVNIQAEYTDALCPGSGIALWAMFANEKGELDELNPVILGADSLGEKSKQAEIVGKEAADNLMKEINSKAPVDKYLADQILPFMALTGNSKILCSEITNHARTNIKVVEDFLGKVFDVDEERRIIKSL